MVKKILLLTLLLFSCSLFSQSHVGITGGLNLAQLRSSAKMANSSITSIPGVHFGIYYLINSGTGASFRPGIQFSQKGFKVKDDNCRLNYVEVPLLFEIPIHLNQGTLFFTLGGYAGLGIGGSYEENFSLNGKQLTHKGDVKFTTSVNEDNIYSFDDDDLIYDLFDAGFSGGIGYRFYPVSIEVNYELGLYNILPEIDLPGYTEDNSRKLYTRTLKISLAYLINMK